MSHPMIIYNLFPRLVGQMDRWPDHARRSQEMGFNWLYINPIQYPGFSGSLYAVKDFYRYNPLFIPPDASEPQELLRQTLDQIHELGLRVMMDLVINHTSKDSVLAAEHPEWYCRTEDGELVSPSAIDPADARQVTVWGDLAELDHEGSPDRAGLWDYWTRLTLDLLDLGFDGFRCDAAYKVPAALWSKLISAARSRKPGTIFAAETLGCRLEEVRELQDVGFDYLFNSSKYWNFDAPWALQQHEEFGQFAPSISFPESHDTPRLMSETDGSVQVQKQRYAFCAIFSAGVMMPVGYEFGFTRPLDVVQTSPEDWEETGLDISPFIKELNRLKSTLPSLGVEGSWQVLTTLEGPTVLLCKHGDRGEAPVLAAINKDWHQPQAISVPSSSLPPAPRLLRPCLSAPSGDQDLALPLLLDPAEVALITE